MPLEINTTPFVGTSLANPGFFTISNPDSTNTLQRPNAELPNVDSFVSNGRFALDVLSFGTVYNDATNNWERIRNNTQFTILSSAARTITITSATQNNWNARGLYIVVYVSAVAGTTPTLTPQLGFLSAGGGGSIPWVATTAITAAGTYAYQIYPGVTQTGADLKQTGSLAVPRNWYITMVIGGTTPSFTFSVDASNIL